MNPQSKVAFIDLDGTLIKGQSQLLLVKYLYKKGLIPTFLIIRLFVFFILYKIGIIKDNNKIFNYSVSFAKGMEVPMLKENISLFVKDVLSKKVYSDSFDLIKKLKNENYKIILLSSAINPLITEVAKLFEIDEYISTNLESENEIYTGKISGEIVYGLNKLEVAKAYLAKNNISVSDSVAYADHETDIPLLKFVGIGYMVNPSPHTQLLATKQGITVIKLR